MKTRNGFVSNSSSTSFVVIGVLLPRKRVTAKQFVEAVCGQTPNEDEESEAIYAIQESDDLCFFNDDETAPKGKTIIGYNAADCEDYGLNDHVVSIEEATAALTPIFEKLGLAPSEVKLSVISGSQAC